ncbi:MAG TPA: hypothetical protein VG457_15200 [Planctomycetota bacterium]|nr:hypothetical protein [Planctomycetota bacterium]
MTCDERAPLLSSLGEGSLGKAQEQELEVHLGSCERCRGLLARLRRMEELLGAGLGVPDPGSGYFRAQRERLLAAGAQPAIPRTQPRRARYVWAAAAAILILAAGAAYWLGIPAAPGGPGSAGLRPSPAPGASPAPVVPPVKPPAPAPPSPGPQVPGPVRESPPAPVLARETPPAPPSAAPARLAAMTEESVDIGLAETPKDRVLALYRAAEARLGELGQAIRRDPPLASELADAYLLLLGEGVQSVLHDGTESQQELALARSAAAERARGHERALVELGGASTGKLKETLEEALAMSRTIGKP